MPRTTQKLVTLLLFVGSIAGGGWLALRFTPFLGVGLFLCGAALALREMLIESPGWRRLVVGLVLLIGLPAVAIGAQQLRCRYQARPEAKREQLFQGVEYVREIVTEPAPAVVHLLIVDLKVPGVEVLVTPPDMPGQLRAVRARTTSQFASEFGLQAAINASNYYPFERRNPWTYWPYAREPKGVVGGAASNGVPYGQTDRFYPALHVSQDKHATIEYPAGKNDNDHWYTAAAGIKHFIKDGRPIHMNPGAPEATTAVGIDPTGTVLVLVVVEGDQSPYSAGIDRPTLTDLLLRYDVHNALGLDGGGSSTMVVADHSGRPRTVNRPVQGTIPGIERPVGNHIGIIAPPLNAP